MVPAPAPSKNVPEATALAPGKFAGPGGSGSAYLTKNVGGRLSPFFTHNGFQKSTPTLIELSSPFFSYSRPEADNTGCAVKIYPSKKIVLLKYGKTYRLQNFKVYVEMYSHHNYMHEIGYFRPGIHDEPET